MKKTVFITGVVACLLLMSIKAQPGLNLYMVDVGQGDCIMAINDTGRCYIFDGGSSDVSSVGEKRIIPMLKSVGVNEIEAIFMSHPDEDHINGIRELVRSSCEHNIRIHNIFVYEGYIDSPDFVQMSCDSRAEPQFSGISSGFCLSDKRFKIECVYPAGNMQISDTNDASLVLHLTYGSFSFLETGDIGTTAEDYMYNNIEETELESTVLKVAHHGSKTSGGEQFLDMVKPGLALISVGKNNRYGHPHDDMLSRLRNRKIEILRTDDNGCIHIFTDGKRMKVTCWNE